MFFFWTIWNKMVFACFYWRYPLVNSHSYGKSPFLMGKSTINGQFSTAILVYQRVHFKTILLVASNHSVVGGWGPGSPKAQPLPPNSIQCIMKHDMGGHFTIQKLFLPYSYHIYHILPYITIYYHKITIYNPIYYHITTRKLSH